MKNYKLKAMLLFAVCLCNFPAFANSLWLNDVFYLLSNNGTALVYSASEDINTAVIPEKITHNGKDYPVTSIRGWAFSGCSSLTSVTIPNSVTSIRGYAFKNCSCLASVTIPNSVTSIGYEAFYRCSSLTSVTIPNSVTSIGGWAFSGCSRLTSITIPNSVTSIGSTAFSHCTNLTSVTIPNSVTSIGDYAFSGCSRLTSVVISNSVTSIESNSFSDCNSLTSITIPNSVTSIGRSAFSKCSRLTSITIPNSVTSIGVGAFYECSDLRKVVSKAIIPPACDLQVFRGINWECTLYVPQECINAYKAAPQWKDFYKIETGIKNVFKPASATEAMRYSTDGTRIASPKKGINIIKMSDGTVKKVLVK